MMITNPKKFEKTVKTLANFCKHNKKKYNKHFYHDVIYFSENKLYATEGHIMAMIDVSDCVDSCSSDNEFFFPSNVIAKKTLETNIEGKLFCDGKPVDAEEIESKYTNCYKKIIPIELPIAELTLDFSEYKSLDVGYDKELAFVEVSKDKVTFDYRDEVGTTCTVEDCFSADLLDNDFGDFQTVKFPMQQIFLIMKISKKFKIQQYKRIDAMHTITADNWNFLIMPNNY